MFEVGTKFKGKINGNHFEIVKIETNKSGTYFNIKDLQTGKIFIHNEDFIKHLQIELEG